MKVQVETVSPIEKRLSIEVEPTIVEKELSAAYAALSKQVKIPGFRPGKVPRRILEQKFRTDVEADVVRRVQLQAFIDAVREHKVQAVGEPHMSGGKLAAASPYAFTARVEVKPDLVTKDYQGLVIKRFDTAITDAQVEEQLQKLRDSRTRLEPLEPLEGRDVAQEGDLARIDFDATLGGHPFPGSSGRDVTIEVRPGELVQGNLPQLAGVKVNDKKEFDYTFPADYRTEEVKGKTARFTVILKGLQQKKTPELNDAFAESLGVGTLADLKAKIRKDLERAQKNRVATDEREEIFKKLIEKNPFDVPQSLVERGVDMMLEAAFGSMARSGVDPRMLNVDWSRLRGDLRPRAEVEVRGQLLLEALSRQEKLEATDEDVERKLEALAEETGQPLSTVRKHYKGDEAKESLKHRIIEDKALDLLKASAKFEEQK